MLKVGHHDKKCQGLLFGLSPALVGTLACDPPIYAAYPWRVTMHMENMQTPCGMSAGQDSNMNLLAQREQRYQLHISEKSVAKK